MSEVRTAQHQMGITQNFNKFYHAILTEAFSKSITLSFRDWKDMNSKGCLMFVRGEIPHGDYDCVASPKGTLLELDYSLKTIFKNMDLDYPISSESKTSTTEITSKELSRHIGFITKVLNENGIEFQHDIDAFERLKQQAGIYD
ncbi:MAG: hypothetical protein GQ474_01570 [Sulfurimonas sp.]|nr:hypothetical protein [Sulfurimonas sp.]